MIVGSSSSLCLKQLKSILNDPADEQTIDGESIVFGKIPLNLIEYSAFIWLVLDQFLQIHI